MTKEKRMEPPRLSLVPSSQESNDNGRDDAGDEPVRAGALPRNVAALPFADHREKLRILEALLFAAAEPLDEAKLAGHLAEGEDIGALIEELRAFYAGRGVNLVQASPASGRSAPPRISPTCWSATPRRSGACRRRRSRRCRSSPTTSR